MTNKMKNYYDDPGKYLAEHDSFLKNANPKKDIAFLVKALKIKKGDKVLDIACGQGRHVNLLAAKGYSVDGLDFSKNLLKLAKRDAKNIKNEIQPHFFLSDINNIKIRKKYQKIYWFFSDLAGIDPAKAIKSISRLLVKNGQLLIDTDNVFRLLNFLKKNKNTGLEFDIKKSKLIDKENKISVPFPSMELWDEYLKNNHLRLEKTYGGYDLSKYGKNSQRLIMVAKKIA